MANLFLETITYITETELKDSTKETNLQGTGTTNENNRKILIRKAEILIDSIIVSYGTKLVEDQETVFPEVTVGIPTAVKKAIVLICENMYLGGELSPMNLISSGSVVAMEKYGDHEVQYQEEKVIKNSLSVKSKYLTAEVEILLKPYITTLRGKWSKLV